MVNEGLKVLVLTVPSSMTSLKFIPLPPFQSHTPAVLVPAHPSPSAHPQEDLAQFGRDELILAALAAAGGTAPAAEGDDPPAGGGGGLCWRVQGHAQRIEADLRRVRRHAPPRRHMPPGSHVRRGILRGLCAGGGRWCVCLCGGRCATVRLRVRAAACPPVCLREPVWRRLAGHGRRGGVRRIDANRVQGGVARVCRVEGFSSAGAARMRLCATH